MILFSLFLAPGIFWVVWVPVVACCVPRIQKDGSDLSRGSDAVVSAYPPIIPKLFWEG